MIINTWYSLTYKDKDVNLHTEWLKKNVGPRATSSASLGRSGRWEMIRQGGGESGSPLGMVIRFSNEEDYVLHKLRWE